MVVFLYYDRIVDVWNDLDDKIVDTDTVGILKDRIDNANSIARKIKIKCKHIVQF